MHVLCWQTKAVPQQHHQSRHMLQCSPPAMQCTHLCCCRVPLVAVPAQVHHLQPSKNMSLTFRHWDDWGGTAAHVPGRASSSPLLIAYNLAFYYCLSHVLSLLATSAAAWAMLGAGALLLALLPAPCGGPLWLRRLRVWDVLRGAYGISLDASACAVAADAEPAGAAAGVQGGLDGRQRYIFCYHPHGVLARGFWWTWMLQGQESPVAAAGLRWVLHLQGRYQPPGIAHRSSVLPTTNTAGPPWLLAFLV